MPLPCQKRRFAEAAALDQQIRCRQVVRLHRDGGSFETRMTKRWWETNRYGAEATGEIELPSAARFPRWQNLI
jgi:hypothetical protein